jgi:uncharacterized glyoxalase superfamily protein PhnB
MAKRRTKARTPRRRARVKEIAPARQPKPAPLAVGSGLAPGMQPVNTYLAVANVGATMAFLERAFGFTRGVVLPDGAGQVRYAEMRHGDAAVMLVPRGDGTAATSGAAALYTYVNDVDRAAEQARNAGAGVGEPEDRPWGDRTVVVTDPDGYRWVLATFRKLVPFQQEGERRKGADRRRT